MLTVPLSFAAVVITDVFQVRLLGVLGIVYSAAQYEDEPTEPEIEHDCSCDGGAGGCETDPLEIAMKELRQRKIPFTIRRYLPDGR
ncbi:unnamed protein product [Microthlaspi erraticum]|uniref:Uncharacterized protein n=1 Tax=Microthlaspi erraticum TaxID=1685480 RepID=A0A6D2J2W3_9BRAS|nr:unnamed protein product [Microthlaspi erraticum]